MTVVIRVDASLHIGIGHVMRCLSLADEIKRGGGDVTFVCRRFNGHCISLIQNRGHIVLSLEPPSASETLPKGTHPPHAQWLGVSWQQDAEETLALLQQQNKNISCTIVDHYALDYRWQSFLKPYSHKIMVIDDLADRKHDCHLLLDQTYARNELDYQRLVPIDCKLLLGSAYALLRPQFAQERRKSLQKWATFKSIRRILVSMGGTDPENITSVILTGLELVSWADPVRIDVVLGKNAPFLAEVRMNALKSTLPINVYSNVNNMASLMSEADLAFGAGGTTSWERCCLGLPSIVISLAKNQDSIARALNDVNAISFIGDKVQINPESIAKKILELVAEPSLIINMSNCAREVCDGKGCARVMGILKEVI